MTIKPPLFITSALLLELHIVIRSFTTFCMVDSISIILNHLFEARQNINREFPRWQGGTLGQDCLNTISPLRSLNHTCGIRNSSTLYWAFYLLDRVRILHLVFFNSQKEQDKKFQVEIQAWDMETYIFLEKPTYYNITINMNYKQDTRMSAKIIR